MYLYLLKNKSFFLKKRSLSGALAGMYDVPGTEWKNNSWPEVPIKLKSINALPKTIKYKMSNIELQTKIYKVNIRNKNAIKELGIWTNYSGLSSLPVSVLTKKIINYCVNEQ